MSNSLTLTRRNCGQYIEKNMELPQNCRSISAETFFNRPDIRSVVFPYEMEQIGNKAFQGCSRLSRIELPEQSGVRPEQQTDIYRSECLFRMRYSYGSCFPCLSGRNR